MAQEGTKCNPLITLPVGLHDLDTGYPYLHMCALQHDHFQMDTNTIYIYNHLIIQPGLYYMYY